MADYIKREDALKFSRIFYDHIWETGGYQECITHAVPVKVIEEIPSADVAEVKHGEWIETIEHNGWVDETCAECSECGEDFILGEMDMDDIRNLFLYCPNCGADMRGNEDG